MNEELKWATEGAEYLQQMRRMAQSNFASVMEEFKGNDFRGQDWFHEGKNCSMTIYHYSEEFAPDARIPGSRFSSPEHFSQMLDEYETFVTSMQEKMRAVLKPFTKRRGPAMPYQATDLLELLNRVRTAIGYVRQVAPAELGPVSDDARTIVERAARQFHEAVLSLGRHPHAGQVLAITDEWDCQYLFKAILSSLIHDVRMEEWSPSVAGSSARCEFLLKSHRLMVELKYARRRSDGKSFKSALLTDLKDYGQHPDVDAVVVLIYDPGQVLENAVQLQRDLSGPTIDLSDVTVIVSPPRSVHGV